MRSSSARYEGGPQGGKGAARLAADAHCACLRRRRSLRQTAGLPSLTRSSPPACHRVSSLSAPTPRVCPSPTATPPSPSAAATHWKAPASGAAFVGGHSFTRVRGGVGGGIVPAWLPALLPPSLASFLRSPPPSSDHRQCVPCAAAYQPLLPPPPFSLHPGLAKVSSRRM